jgi:hypothetical protein
MTITKETDLYDPCKTLLESLGYQVKAEVGAIDIMAIKDDYMVIVELKLKISLKLIYQAIDRQKLADKVYIALPKTVINQTKSNVKHFLNLLKRLEIGLIVVSNNQAEVLVETFGFDLKRSITASKKKKEKLMKEFTLRKSDMNVGGTKSKKMTHYKEKVIEIAKYLREFGQKSPKEIVLYTGIKDTPNILRKNYYMWFINVERGIYQLSEIGKKALDELTL